MQINVKNAPGPPRGRKLIDTMLKKTLALITVLSALAATANAQFTGAFAPEYWTLTTNGGTGSVDTTGAPSQIILTGSDTSPEGFTGPAKNTDFSILFTSDATVSFDWDYLSDDTGAYYDQFGYRLNGSFVKLTTDSGSAFDFGNEIQNGSLINLAVNAGDTFGFYIDAISDASGPAHVTISNFSAVPEPSTYAAFLGAGVFGWVVVRRRRNAA